ncbi:MAG: cytochrome c biogenesis protein CcdA [Acidimicrobiia bacterium]
MLWRARTGYVLLAVGVVALSVAGYTGYVLYPRFGLPRAAGIGLQVLATAAGVAAFFSPCSFPLLVTLLARETGEGEERQVRLGRALLFASSLSIGAVAFVLGMGSLFALGGARLAASVTFTSPAGRTIRLVVGAFLVLLGLVQAGLLPLSFHGVERLVSRLRRPQVRLRRRRPVVGFALFGFGYLLAGFG